MIDWNSPEWGTAGKNVHGDEQVSLFVSPYARLVGDPRVTEDSHGSWLRGAHGEENES